MAGRSAVQFEAFLKSGEHRQLLPRILLSLNEDEVNTQAHNKSGWMMLQHFPEFVTIHIYINIYYLDIFVFYVCFL